MGAIAEGSIRSLFAVAQPNLHVFVWNKAYRLETGIGDVMSEVSSVAEWLITTVAASAPRIYFILFHKHSRRKLARNFALLRIQVIVALDAVRLEWCSISSTLR